MIRVSGALVDAVVEGNTVKNSDVGIEIRSHTGRSPEGVVRRNRFENVVKPLGGDASSKVLLVQ